MVIMPCTIDLLPLDMYGFSKDGNNGLLQSYMVNTTLSTALLHLAMYGVTKDGNYTLYH
jgi:hypothetical protein